MGGFHLLGEIPLDKCSLGFAYPVVCIPGRSDEKPIKKEQRL